MTLWDELYFEITMHGAKAEIKKVISFLKSGELDDFFEVTPDYIILDDGYPELSDAETTDLVFSNDDYGIEIEEFDTDEFLEVLCKAAKRIDVYGTLCDSDGNEFNFTSAAGDSYYVNSRKATVFNDELDAVALDEEKMADDE